MLKQVYNQLLPFSKSEGNKLALSLLSTSDFKDTSLISRYIFHILLKYRSRISYSQGRMSLFFESSAYCRTFFPFYISCLFGKK